MDTTKIGLIGVSFDVDRKRWLTTIKTDKLWWPQVCDLKGDDSPNITNWNISMIPNYTLLDGEGRVLATDLQYDAVEFSINNYLAKH